MSDGLDSEAAVSPIHVRVECVEIAQEHVNRGNNIPNPFSELEEFCNALHGAQIRLAYEDEQLMFAPQRKSAAELKKREFMIWGARQLFVYRWHVLERAAFRATTEAACSFETAESRLNALAGVVGRLIWMPRPPGLLDPEQLPSKIDPRTWPTFMGDEYNLPLEAELKGIRSLAEVIEGRRRTQLECEGTMSDGGGCDPKNRATTSATPADIADTAITVAGQSPTEKIEPKKSKRSTEPGEAQAKLIAALTKHHQYAHGSCLHLEPIGVNELARLAEVSSSTASVFFSQKFNPGNAGGWRNYCVVCRDAGRLAESLKTLNGEFCPYHLYGRQPVDEQDRDEDE